MATMTKGSPSWCSPRPPWPPNSPPSSKRTASTPAPPPPTGSATPCANPSATPSTAPTAAAVESVSRSIRPPGVPRTRPPRARPPRAGLAPLLHPASADHHDQTTGDRPAGPTLASGGGDADESRSRRSAGDGAGRRATPAVRPRLDVAGVDWCSSGATRWTARRGPMSATRPAPRSARSGSPSPRCARCRARSGPRRRSTSARPEGIQRSVVHRHGWVTVWVGPVSDDLAWACIGHRRSPTLARYVRTVVGNHSANTPAAADRARSGSDGSPRSGRTERGDRGHGDGLRNVAQTRAVPAGVHRRGAAGDPDARRPSGDPDHRGRLSGVLRAASAGTRRQEEPMSPSVLATAPPPAIPASAGSWPTTPG